MSANRDPAGTPLLAGTPSSSASGLEPVTRHPLRPASSGKRPPELKRTTSAKASLPTQVLANPWQKDKLVLLPNDRDGASTANLLELDEDVAAALAASEPQLAASHAVAGAFPVAPQRQRPNLRLQPYRGRITVYCISDSIDRRSLLSLLALSFPSYTVTPYSDVVHVEIPDVGNEPGMAGDAFFFEYGVVALWGMSQPIENSIIAKIARGCERSPLPEDEVDVDEFMFNFSADEVPNIQNDTFTINRRKASDHQVRLAISHALAQAMKLSVYEARVVGLVEETRVLPQALATHGRVRLSSRRLTRLIGKVFLQSSTVNLLSKVLDTPDFFWSAPDSLQALYERACEYLELEKRTGRVNARFQVLQEMLDMLRDQQNNFHGERLELIIIALLFIDCVFLLVKMFSLFGWV